MALPIEQSDADLRARGLGRFVWEAVARWDAFAKRTVGEQLVTSMDSVAANLVEGDGRGSDRDAARFFLFARASGREARHWLDVSAERTLLPNEAAHEMLQELTEAVKMINGLIAHRRKTFVNEDRAPYDLDFESINDTDPFNA